MPGIIDARQKTDQGEVFDPEVAVTTPNVHERFQITQDIRDYAAEHGLNAEEDLVEIGMAQKAEEFNEMGGEIYVPLEVEERVETAGAD